MTQLLAQSPEALLALSSHWQDALVASKHIVYQPRNRRLVLLGVRVCHERPRSWRGVARTRSLLQFRGVLGVKQKHIDTRKGHLLSVLAMLYAPADLPACSVRVVCAGGAELKLELESLDITMQDEGKRWRSWRVPRHIAEAEKEAE